MTNKLENLEGCIFWKNNNTLIAQKGFEWANDISLVPDAEWETCCALSDAEWAAKGYEKISAEEAEELLEITEITYEDWIRDQIAQVANGQTDFAIGFDKLFQFMSDNPDSETTQDFVSYHYGDCNDPKTQEGQASFIYLIGKDFVPGDWIAESDMLEFAKLCITTDCIDILKPEICVEEADYTWYVGTLTDSVWLSWDDANLPASVTLHESREKAVSLQRDGFEATGLSEDCWILE